MSIGKLPIFTDSIYTQQSITNPECFKKNIYMSNTLLFSYNSVSYKNYTPEKRTLWQRIQLISIIQGVLEVIGNIARLALQSFVFTLDTIRLGLYFSKPLLERRKELKNNFQLLKQTPYRLIRSLEGIIGNIISPFHNKAGSYLENEKRFQKECYEIYKKKTSFLAMRYSEFQKIALTSYKIMRESEKKELKYILDESKDPFLNENDARYNKIFNEENRKFLNFLSATDLTLKSKAIEYALMSDEDLKKLTLTDLKTASKKAARIASKRLMNQTESVTTVSNISTLTLTQFKSFTKEQLNSNLLNIPYLAFHLLTKDQINCLDFSKKTFTPKTLNKFLIEIKDIALTESQLFDLTKLNQLFKSDKTLKQKNNLLLLSFFNDDHFKHMKLNENKIKLIEVLFTVNEHDFAKKFNFFSFLDAKQLSNNLEKIPPSLFHFILPHITQLNLRKISKKQLDTLIPDVKNQEKPDSINRKTLNFILLASLSERNKDIIYNRLSDFNKEMLSSISTR